MREERGKLRFEDSDRDPQALGTVPSNDTTKKQKRRHKFEIDEPTMGDTSVNTGNSAITHDTALAKTPVTSNENSPNKTPVGEVPTVAIGGNVDNAEKVGGSSRLTGLQHGASQVIRNLMPDETPDRNAGVSATRFASVPKKGSATSFR